MGQRIAIVSRMEGISAASRAKAGDEHCAVQLSRLHVYANTETRFIVFSTFHCRVARFSTWLIRSPGRSQLFLIRHSGATHRVGFPHRESRSIAVAHKISSSSSTLL